MLRDMLKTVVMHRPKKFRPNDQAVVGHPINATLDEMSRAGLMTGLDDCCRTVVSDEADMMFQDIGLFLSHNTLRASSEMNCRGLLLCYFNQ